MSARVWDNLSDDLKNIFNEVMVEVEARSVEIMAEIIEEETKRLVESGVEIVELEDADHFTATANKAAWEWFAQRAPQRAAEMEPMFRRQ